MKVRKLLTLASSAALIGVLLVGAFGSALAANPTGPGQGFFQLDASLDLSNGQPPKAAVTDPIAAPDTQSHDWDQVAADHGLATNGAGPSGANATSFDAETTATGTANNATIFTGGGSKDQQPISAWGWKDASGGLPDKDNLLHAMSARYGSGATAHIYFGADRFDNSGDSQIGFWFFNGPVAVGPNGTFTGAHTAGTVPHSASTPGDILILSDFTNGGAQPTIRVFEYVGSGGSDGSLNLLGGNATDVRDCAIVSTDDFCAAVNNLDGAVAPWLFRNKSGQTSFGHGEFYEGGLNLTTLGLQNECFSSFLAETRSSQSVTATLKDFVAGPFQDCHSGVVTTPSAGSDGSDSIGTGSVQETDQAVLTVTGASTFGGSISFHICGPTPLTDANYTLCTTGGTLVGASKPVSQPSPATVNSDAATLTSAGRYCWRADYTGDAAHGVPASSDSSVTECFKVTPVTPALTTDASSGPVALGQTISDTAHLSGTATQPDGSKAGGSITFTVYGPDNCTTVAFTSSNPVTVSGNGDYPSGNFTPTAAGTYHFAATYTGNPPNTNGASATACPDATEDVTVSPVTPTLTTQSSADPVLLGAAISDTAHLTGTANRPNGDPAGGTISFTAYGPDNCTTVAFGPVTINVSGDGFYGGAGSAAEFPPTAAGNYTWVASYSGDLPNTTAAGPTACPDANEDVTVNSIQPTLTTAQTWTVFDSATVVATGGGDLAGSVHFQLFTNSTCSGTAVTGSDQTLTVVDGGTKGTETVSTTALTFTTSQPTLYWKVSYHSTNPAQKDIPATCTENSNLTVTN